MTLNKYLFDVKGKSSVCRLHAEWFTHSHRIHLLDRNVLCTSYVPSTVVTTVDNGDNTDQVSALTPLLFYSAVAYVSVIDVWSQIIFCWGLLSGALEVLSSIPILYPFLPI